MCQPSVNKDSQTNPAQLGNRYWSEKRREQRNPSGLCKSICLRHVRPVYFHTAEVVAEAIEETGTDESSIRIGWLPASQWYLTTLVSHGIEVIWGCTLGSSCLFSLDFLPGMWTATKSKCQYAEVVTPRPAIMSKIDHATLHMKVILFWKCEIKLLRRF